MQGRFDKRTALSLYRIIVTATSVMVVTKMGNTVPRAGIAPTSLAFWASVLPFHHVGSLMSPLYPSYLSMWLFCLEVSTDYCTHI